MLSNLMRHFWSSPRTRQQHGHTDAADDAANESPQRPSDVQPPSDAAPDAPSTSESSAAPSSAAANTDDADDPMDISFMHTPSSAAAMPITPFPSQMTASTSSRPSPVPFNLLRSSASINTTGRRVVPPVPLFAAVESKAAEPTATVGAKGRARGRFAAPDREEEKETVDDQPTTKQPFTVRVEDETQRTTFQYTTHTTAAPVEESKEVAAQPHDGVSAAAAENADTKKRKRDSSDMVDIDDDITQSTQHSPQTNNPTHHSSSASPASAASSDDDDIPHSIKKLRISDDTPPTTTPPSSSSTAAPRKRDSLTSLLNSVTMGWYSSLYNKMHAPTAESVIQAGMNSMGLKEEETAAEEGEKEGRGGARMDEIKRYRSDKRERQLKERQQDKAERREQGDDKGRTGVKHVRAAHKHTTSHNQPSENTLHRQIEQVHTDSTQQHQHRLPTQQHATEHNKVDDTDSRETTEHREENSRAGPKAAVKEAGEEARRKRMLQGAERRRQGREHTLLEKREMQRKKEEEARREAEQREEEEREARRTEDEQRRRQAALLEQARAIQMEREETERQKVAEEQRERERAEQRDREAQRQRERERERDKREREQQQQRQRAADKENIQTHNRPPTTNTDDTPRRSTRLSSLQQTKQPTTTAAPPVDDTISARLHARRIEKDERDRLQQQEREERERVVPHVERCVRQRARGKDYVGLVREFAPQLLEGKGRVVGVEVRKVLRRCMALYHPDKWQTRSVRERVESEHVFAVIQRAYEECGS